MPRLVVSGWVLGLPNRDPHAHTLALYLHVAERVGAGAEEDPGDPGECGGELPRLDGHRLPPLLGDLVPANEPDGDPADPGGEVERQRRDGQPDIAQPSLRAANPDNDQERGAANRPSPPP